MASSTLTNSEERSRIAREIHDIVSHSLSVVVVMSEGAAVPVPAGVDLAVYRIVQEALTNVRKHAGAFVQNVEVRLDYGSPELEVRVTDDGQSVRGEADGQAVGHGLVGMRERVAAYGGTLRTGMRPSGGFEVTAVLPIGDAQ